MWLGVGIPVKMMKNIGAVILVLYLSLNPCVGLSSNETESLDDYIRQNKRQYDAKIKQYEDEIANFKNTFNKQLNAIDLQANQLEFKLDELAARLNPIELIDSWHRQCVLNYSSSIPTITSVRSTLTSCSTTAQNNLNSILSNVQSTYTTLKNYYNNNLKNSLADCVKKNPESLLNYTLCVTQVISNANVYTVSNQKTFTTYIGQAQCSADSRITTAWECSFTTVFATSSSLGIIERQVNDCIDNRVTCGSLATCASPRYCDVLYLTGDDVRNSTIRNPFINVNKYQNCWEVWLTGN